MVYKRLVLLFAILCFSTIAYSQLVNTESSRKEEKEGLQGHISFAFSHSQTTSDITQLQNGASLQYSKGRHTYLFLNSIEFLRVKTGADKLDLANQNFQHIRYNYNFRDTSATIWEVFVQHQQNKIKYQDLRIITGTGPRFRVVNTNALSLYLCPLVMYEHEQEFETINNAIDTHVLKGDFYAVVIYRATDELTLRHVTYYQPAFIDFTKSQVFEPLADFRIASETALTISFLEDKIEFSAVFNLSHDSRPPGLYILDSGNDRMTFLEFKNEIKVNF